MPEQCNAPQVRFKQLGSSNSGDAGFRAEAVRLFLPLAMVVALLAAHAVHPYLEHGEYRRHCNNSQEASLEMSLVQWDDMVQQLSTATSKLSGL